MYITNEVEIAMIAEKAGVDYVWVDLEVNGKLERQGHLDTVISNHSIDDVKKIKNCLTVSKLLVRINPINIFSKDEIDLVIENGADIIMLPFFKKVSEVEKFINFVNGRVETMLLLETPEAVLILDDILGIPGIDSIHVGLNDLHLGYKKKFMFELLIDGTVELIAKKVTNKKMPFGFGGVAQLGKGDLPAEIILVEHSRLGSTQVILSRGFFRNSNQLTFEEKSELFVTELKKIKIFETELLDKDFTFFSEKHSECEKIIKRITNIIDEL